MTTPKDVARLNAAATLRKIDQDEARAIEAEARRREAEAVLRSTPRVYSTKPSTPSAPCADPIQRRLDALRRDEQRALDLMQKHSTVKGTAWLDARSKLAHVQEQIRILESDTLCAGSMMQPLYLVRHRGPGVCPTCGESRVPIRSDGRLRAHESQWA